MHVTHTKEDHLYNMDNHLYKMDRQLEVIAKSYNKGIDYGKRGINIYDNFPEYITNDPYYEKWKLDHTQGDSKGSEIVEYLMPHENMNFIDLGCCLNLIFHGYDKWPSTYHGMDISNETIKLLKRFAADKELSVGALVCGSIHETPFADSYFDIGACIGVLEYYEKDFVEKSILEMHRITKPNGKYILDIPNIGDPMCQLMMLIEERIGRPDRFALSSQEFEDILQNYFIIDKAKVGPMIQYYLRCKK